MKNKPHNNLTALPSTTLHFEQRIRERQKIAADDNIKSEIKSRIKSNLFKRCTKTRKPGVLKYVIYTGGYLKQLLPNYPDTITVIYDNKQDEFITIY